MDRIMKSLINVEILIDRGRRRKPGEMARLFEIDSD